MKLSKFAGLAMFVCVTTNVVAQEQDEEEERQEGTLYIYGTHAGTAHVIAPQDPVAVAKSGQVEEARRALEEALDALTAAEGHSEAISRIAPYVSALSPQLELLENNIAYALRASGTNSGVGFIGIRLGDANRQGVEIVSVAEGSPAHSNDLQSGDIVTSVDGVQIRDADDPTQALGALINAVEPGTTIKLRIVRDGKQVSKSIVAGSRIEYPRIFVNIAEGLPTSSYVLANRPDLASLRNLRTLALLEFESELGHYFGLEFGVLVVDAPENRKLKKGDVLLSINDKPVRSFSHAKRYFAGSDEVADVVVKRRGKEHKLQLLATDLLVIEVRGT